MAYAPSNMIPGIEPSPDKMLQVRTFTCYLRSSACWACKGSAVCVSTCLEIRRRRRRRSIVGVVRVKNKMHVSHCQAGSTFLSFVPSFKRPSFSFPLVTFNLPFFVLHLPYFTVLFSSFILFSRAASSPTTTPTGTGWEPTTSRSR